MNGYPTLIRSSAGQFSARLLSDPDKVVRVWEIFDGDGEIIETTKMLFDVFSPVMLGFYERGWRRAYEKGKADGAGELHAKAIDAINGL